MNKLLLPMSNQMIFVTQPFGVNFVDFYKKLGLKGHNGVDFRAKRGAQIIAAHNGEVSAAGTDSSGGVYIELITNKSGPGFKTIYYHLKDKNVIKGDKVKEGQVIGTANNTGKYTTGDHLHFGLKPLKRLSDGTFVNLEQGNGYAGSIDPGPYFPNNDMLYVISDGDQYLINERLKLALSIGDEAELNILKANGLQGHPDSVSGDYIKQFVVYPLVRKDRLKDILNF